MSMHVNLPNSSKMSHEFTAAKLQNTFSTWGDLEFAVLVGSRAAGTERPGSDWDIAVLLARWSPGWTEYQKQKHYDVN